MLLTDSPIIEIHETYPKQTFRNRCNIATSSGILSLTVPVIRTNGNHTKTCDINIDNSKNWQQHQWRSIITAYNKSPYFLYYRDLFEPVYHKKHERLINLNQELIEILLKALNIRNIRMIYTDHYDLNPDFCDFRNSFQPRNRNIQSLQLEFPRYMQTFEAIQGFLPDLSTLDVLFNLGPDALSYLESLKLSPAE